MPDTLNLPVGLTDLARDLHAVADDAGSQAVDQYLSQLMGLVDTDTIDMETALADVSRVMAEATNPSRLSELLDFEAE